MPPLSPLASTYYAAASSLSPHGELNFNSSLSLLPSSILLSIWLTNCSIKAPTLTNIVLFFGLISFGGEDNGDGSYRDGALVVRRYRR